MRRRRQKRWVELSYLGESLSFLSLFLWIMVPSRQEFQLIWKVDLGHEVFHFHDNNLNFSKITGSCSSSSTLPSRCVIIIVGHFKTIFADFFVSFLFPKNRF
jgi:hypothetical protein